MSIGRGDTPEAAELVALAEAAERYSIQFCADMPAELVPMRTVGGPAAPIATVELTLGAPGRRNSSAGAAAGADLDDATRRAALELLERLHLDELRAGGTQLHEIDPADVPATVAHARWLAGQLRRLDCRAGWFQGYAAAACACSDLDGGRRTEGSAARADLETAVLAAVEEAVFHWRNMVELERSGADLAAMPPEDRAGIARYRGAAPRGDWPAPPPGAPVRAAPPGGADALLAALARRSGRRVRVFDLTVPEVGVPVVKAVLG